MRQFGIIHLACLFFIVHIKIFVKWKELRIHTKLIHTPETEQSRGFSLASTRSIPTQYHACMIVVIMSCNRFLWLVGV